MALGALQQKSSAWEWMVSSLGRQWPYPILTAGFWHNPEVPLGLLCHQPQHMLGSLCYLSQN